MSNNNFPRMSGIAGIVSALSMLAISFTMGSDGIPSGPLFMLFSAVAFLSGLVFSAGLYFLYRDQAGALNLVAAAASVLGYLLFMVILATSSFDPNNRLTAAADILVYIVGMSLFSWLAYQSGRMPRALSFVGFFGGLAGVGNYILFLGVGMKMDSPLVTVFYTLYLLAVVVWLVWTGIVLMAGKTKMVTA